MASNTRRLFGQHLGQLSAAGAFAALAEAGLRFVLAGVVVSSLWWEAWLQFQHVFIAVLVIYLGAAPLAWAGLWYTIVQSQKGETIRFQDYGRAIARYWSRMLALTVYSMLAWALVAGIAAFVSAPLNNLLASITLFGLGSGVALLFYGLAPYLVVADDLLASQAVGRAVQMFRHLPRDVFGLMWIPLLYTWGGEWLGMVAGSALLHMLLATFLLPLAGLYLAERHRTAIAPAMRMWHQGGRFHTDPTTPGL